MKVRKEILSVVHKNKEREKTNTYYTEMLADSLITNKDDTNSTAKTSTDHLENILDIRLGQS